MNTFTTQSFSLSQIGSLCFVIPSYQRPYVWDGEPLSRMVDDLAAACRAREPHYFMGTILTTIPKESTDLEEVIDGQQRFTSFWLLAAVLRRIRHESPSRWSIPFEMESFLKVGDQLRVSFAIRDKLKEYLEHLLSGSEVSSEHWDRLAKDDEYLAGVIHGVTVLYDLLKELEEKHQVRLEAFDTFVYQRVFFVRNTAPAGTDLNRLFVNINNSGIQLEQTDILKAYLLNRLDDDHKKVQYGAAWDFCADMGQVLVKNYWSDFKPENRGKSEALHRFDRPLIENWLNRDSPGGGTPGDTGDNQIATTIEALLKAPGVPNPGNTKTANDPKDDPDDESNVGRFRSILSFGQLLLHAYRIFLMNQKAEKDFQQAFHVRNLTETFKSEFFKEKNSQTAQNVENFIALLWEIRYLFDLHTVKWVRNEETKEEELANISINDREKEKKKYIAVETKPYAELTSLQRVLYFTANRNTQIWLTPFLYALHQQPDENAYAKLVEIDNILSLSIEEDRPTTWKIMRGEPVNHLNLCEELARPQGTGFKRYWFQKLEHVLWVSWQSKDDPKFSAYRIASRNSVEHVFPQQPEYGLNLSENAAEHQRLLDSFGNLVLLSVGQNSSYGRNTVIVKRDAFKHKSVFDSLKLARMFGSFVEDWNAAAIEDHQEDMIALLEKWYGVTCQSSPLPE